MIVPTRFTDAVFVDVTVSFDKPNQMCNMTVHEDVNEKFELGTSMFPKISSFENTPKTFDRRIGVDNRYLPNC
jgi:hypothetical protein